MLSITDDFRSTVLKQAGGDPSGWTVPPWTLEADREINRALGVKKTILSVTAPGACIEKDAEAAARLARQFNDDAAAIRDAARPGEYGFFASLPSLLDTELALREMSYAFDELHADGVILFTRYGHDSDGNHYLGHAVFRPVWRELNRRRAVVLVHPTHAADTRLVNAQLPQPMFDYPHETGRAAIDMIVSDTLASTAADCRIILAHAGGTLPYLVYRPAGLLPHTPFAAGDKSTEQIVAEASRFYFDVAISSNPLTLDLLLRFAQPGHVLFGTDFPNAPTEAIKYFTANFDRFPLSAAKRREIDHEAAAALFSNE